MEALEKFESGTKLLDALKSGEVSGDGVYVGMVKESEKDDHIAFAPGSCDEGWIDVPAELVGDVEVLRQVPCRDHTHPLVRLQLSIDESNPVHAMARQMFATAASRASVAPQLPVGPALGGQQGQQLASLGPLTSMSGVTGPSISAALPVFGGQVGLTKGPIGGGGLGMRFPSTEGSARVRLPAPLRGAGGQDIGTGIIECDVDCCAACCRDCFPIIGCRDYPCCELSNCKISL